MNINLSVFENENLFDATHQLFSQLGITLNSNTAEPLPLEGVLGEQLKSTEIFAAIDKTYFVGLIDDSVLSAEDGETEQISFTQAEDIISENYKGLMVFAVEIKHRKTPTANQLRHIARAFNKVSKQLPVVVIYKFNNNISFANCERLKYLQTYRQGEKIGKVSILHNINIQHPHQGHLRILQSLSVEKIRQYDRRLKLQTFNELNRAWQNVFNTNVLGKEFYIDYQQLSRTLINTIYPTQIENKLVAHQGVLNLLNRLMFIYFVQKKEWIMANQNFIIHLWHDYQKTNQKDKFHKDWLNSIFFSAFNGVAFKDPKAIKALPEPYLSEIINFPYLNGGLFAYNDEHDNFILPDASFTLIFEFFESYIFTIAEDTPYEINLEINPELLGKMYEGMINATDLDDVDAENGIIYTERPEINFMARRSFVEVLDKKLNGAMSREFLYHFVFDEPAQKREILKRYKANTEKLWQAIATTTVCDPACGSGSMLLGVIQLQMELLRVLDEYDKKPHTPQDDFNIKKQLISESIFGVDIKEWAVRIAELRLWLYMIAEAEFTTEQLTKTPLLPNLDFKLRKGNSLLQKFGSIDFSVDELLKASKNKNAGAARQLKEFIKKKKAFITNQTESNTTYKKLKAEEFTVFNRFIDELIIERKQSIHNLGVQNVKQADMFGHQKPEQKSVFEQQTIQLSIEVDQLRSLKDNIIKDKQLPFSYDIDFMEVFLTADDPGFDLIIGNPPYVGFEHILPPENGEYLEYLLKKENKAEKAKVNKEYKESLNGKVYKTYPFLATTIKTEIEGKIKTIPLYGNKVPGRSDLYCYFQLLCPYFLNSKGTLSFIIGNSWLDVEFGSFVQQFLLKHTLLYAVYDSSVRSFDAKVNTVVYLHSALQNHNENGDSFYKTLKVSANPVRFIMNKTDYTQAAYAPLLVEQEHCNHNTFRDLYRVIPINQDELFNQGCDINEAIYTGNKWGGIYIKAPEIFFEIQKKENVIQIKDGDFDNLGYVHDNSTGGNYPIINFIKSVKDIKHLLIEKEDSIKFGVDDKPQIRIVSPILFPRTIGDKHKILFNDGDVIGKEFYRIIPKDNEMSVSIALQLNSTFGILQREIFGISGLGDGALKFNLKSVERFNILPQLKLLKSDFIKFLKREQLDVLSELGFEPSQSIREQIPNPLPDRKALDDIIFDALELTPEERNEVYYSVAELVKQRIDKAASR